jgi:DNA-binding CsgD family transcriptional regulator
VSLADAPRSSPVTKSRAPTRVVPSPDLAIPPWKTRAPEALTISDLRSLEPLDAGKASDWAAVPSAPARAPAAWSALRQAIDLLSEGIAVCSANATVLHRNGAFERVLKRDPGGRRLLGRIQELARSLVIRGGCEVVEQELFTGSRHYFVRLQLMDCEVSGATLVAIALEAAPDQPASLDDLRKRFTLTAREAEIALLLAAGRSNAQIARTLTISAHTARHHTERVLTKLGVRSRAEVGPRIRCPRSVVFGGGPGADGVASRSTAARRPRRNGMDRRSTASLGR